MNANIIVRIIRKITIKTKAKNILSILIPFLIKLIKFYPIIFQAKK